MAEVEPEDQTAYELWCCFYFVVDSFDQLVNSHPTKGVAGQFEDRRKKEQNVDELIRSVARTCRSHGMTDSAVESGRRRAAKTLSRDQQAVAAQSPFLDAIITDPVIVKMVLDA